PGSPMSDFAASLPSLPHRRGYDLRSSHRRYDIRNDPSSTLRTRRLPVAFSPESPDFPASHAPPTFPVVSKTVAVPEALPWDSGTCAGLAEKRQLPVYSRRLREAREAYGVSQRNLGIEAGLDDFVASTRINRYETGVHQPDLQTLQRLAAVLGLPVAYFYAEDDELARLIREYQQQQRKGRGKGKGKP